MKSHFSSLHIMSRCTGMILVLITRVDLGERSGLRKNVQYVNHWHARQFLVTVLACQNMILKCMESMYKLHSVQAKYYISFVHCYVVLKDNFELFEIVDMVTDGVSFMICSRNDMSLLFKPAGVMSPK
jgi:hypothetical protein